MQLAFLGCSDLCVIDQQSNRLSLINLVEDLNVGFFPTLLSSFTVVAIATRAPSENQVQVSNLTITLNAQQLVATPATFDFQSHLRSRVVIQYQGFPLHGPGTLRVELAAGGALLGSWQVQITGAALAQAVPVPQPSAASTVSQGKIPAAKPPTASGRKRRPTSKKRKS
jgi:hypothetical protein